MTSATTLISRARSVVEKATPGPWKVHPSSLTDIIRDDPDEDGACQQVAELETYGEDEYAEANGTALCLARNTFAALLKVYEATQDPDVDMEMAVIAATAALRAELGP